MDWPERLASAALAAAAISLIFFGGVISATAFALSGFMGWTRVFEQVLAQGKPTLPNSGRAIVAGVLAIAGVLAMPSEAKDAPNATAIEGKAGPRSIIVSGEPADSDPARKKATLVEGQKLEDRNKTKIRSLLADLNTLQERDYETRLTFWNDIVALAPANLGYARKRQELTIKVARLDALREHPEQGVIVEKVRGRKEAFGNVLVIDITLRNDSRSNLKDFPITCESKAPSGSVISTSRRSLYEMVKARSSRTFRKVNMGLVNHQIVKTNCTVGVASIA